MDSKINHTDPGFEAISYLLCYAMVKSQKLNVMQPNRKKRELNDGQQNNNQIGSR